VALNLTLLALTGCGLATQPNSYPLDYTTTTMNYFPSVTTTTVPYVPPALSCTISVSSAAAVTGVSVTFTVTAANGKANGKYQFDNLYLTLREAKKLKPVSPADTNSKATVDYAFLSSGQHPVRTTVSNDKGESATCQLVVHVEDKVLDITTLNSNFVGSLGGTINLTATPSGLDPSRGVYYDFQVDEPGVTKSSIRVSNDGGNIQVKAADRLIHNNVTITVTAYTDDLKASVENQVKVAFLPPLDCRSSLVGSPNVNTDLTLTVYSRNPLTGRSSGEELVMTAGDVPDLTVTDVQDSQGNIIGNVKTLRFAKKGPYAPYFTVHSPLRNADCTFSSSGVFSQILILTNDFDKNGKAIFTVY
jgi:hypothetical protein